MLEREYLRESLSYVLAIQDVQERIKFEFVETLLSFMSGWLVFYHLGHEIAEDAKQYMTDLQHKVQKVRELLTKTTRKRTENICTAQFMAFVWCVIFVVVVCIDFRLVHPSGAQKWDKNPVYF